MAVAAATQIQNTPLENNVSAVGGLTSAGRHTCPRLCLMHRAIFEKIVPSVEPTATDLDTFCPMFEEQEQGANRKTSIRKT